MSFSLYTEKAKTNLTASLLLEAYLDSFSSLAEFMDSKYFFSAAVNSKKITHIKHLLFFRILMRAFLVVFNFIFADGLVFA